MHNPVNWFEIYVSDIDRASAFYSKVLGKELQAVPSPGEGEMQMFPGEPGNPNCSGAIIKQPMSQPGPGGTMVYFQCDDVANEAGRVAEAGGKVLMEKRSIGEHGFIAMFEDTEGNHVGLHSRA